MNHRIEIRASFTGGVRVGQNTEIIQSPVRARLPAKPSTYNPGRPELVRAGLGDRLLSGAHYARAVLAFHIHCTLDPSQPAWWVLAASFTEENAKAQEGCIAREGGPVRDRAMPGLPCPE